MNDSESNRFADWAVWVLVFVFGLLFYVFAYPPALMLFDSRFSIASNDLVGTMIDFSVLPLEWLRGSVPVYERYLDALVDRIY